jgi:hypothetical protein
MADPVDARRRWWGLFCLTLAAGLVVWGQTVLRDRLVGWGFILYWVICLAFTTLAVLIALLDVQAVRRRLRRQHLDLVERTMHDVDRLPAPPPAKPNEKTEERK